MADPAAPFDPFGALGFEGRNASDAEIRARYRQLAQRYHPNRVRQTSTSGSNLLSNQFHLVNRAWEILRAPEQKRRCIERLQLHDLLKSVRQNSKNFDHDAEQALSVENTPQVGREPHDLSDEDENSRHVAAPSKRSSLGRQPGGASPLGIIAEEGLNAGKQAIAGSFEHCGRAGNSHGRNPGLSEVDHTPQTDNRRWTRQHLWQLELRAFTDYYDAVQAKHEAEETVATHRKQYEEARRRREIFLEKPKSPRERFKWAIMVVKSLNSLKTPNRTNIRRDSNTSDFNILSPTSPGHMLSPTSPGQSLAPPPPTGSRRRRNRNTDVTGDQSSSDEDDHSSGRATSPGRDPRQLPQLLPWRRESVPVLLHHSTEPALDQHFEDMSPVHGPIRVEIQRTSSLHDEYGSAASQLDNGVMTSGSTERSRKPSSNFFAARRSPSPRDRGMPLRQERGPGSEGSTSPMSSPKPMPEIHDIIVKQVGQPRHPHIPAQNVHELDLEGKRKFLGADPEFGMNPHQLMRRLEALDSRVASKYNVKQDMKNQFRFRLISDGPVQSRQSFIALSYRRRIQVKNEGDRFALPLEPTMFQAVLDERQDVNEGVWIDQICIDNEDDEERTTAMAAMDLVYRSARMVVVALDDVELKETEAKVLLRHMDGFEDMTTVPAKKRFRHKQPPYLESHGDLYGVIRKILYSSWFRRAWCRHEMRLARDLVFLIPCLGWHTMGTQGIVRFDSNCLAHFLGLASETAFSDRIQVGIAPLLGFFRDRTEILKRGQRHNLQHGNFTTVVAEVMAMEAGGAPHLPKIHRDSDARKDKIAIILNTMECGLALRASVRDHSHSFPIQECHYMLLILALAACDPGALSSAGQPLLYLPSPEAQPSYRPISTWLFEPTNIDAGLNNYRTLNRLPLDCHIVTERSADDQHYVELALEYVGGHDAHRTIDDQTHLSRNVKRAADDPETLSQARAIFAYSNEPRNLGHNRKSYLFITDTTTNLGNPSEIHIETLACVLACGYKFMESIAHHYGVSRRDQDMPVAKDFMTAMKSTGGKWPQEAWWHKDTGIGFLMDFVNFLLIRGLPQRQILDPEPWGPVWVDRAPGHGGKVLTFLPTVGSGQPPVRPAVPVALLDKDYIHLARLWVLEARVDGQSNDPEETDEWILRGKSVLFSDSEAMEHLSQNAGPIKSKQKVFGREIAHDRN